MKDAWRACGGGTLNTRGKGAFDLVTDVDFAMERYIADAIRENFPGDTVVGEELNPLRELPSGRAWTVDPIDGTVNMAHGLPLSGCSARSVWTACLAARRFISPVSRRCTPRQRAAAQSSTACV